MPTVLLSVPVSNQRARFRVGVLSAVSFVLLANAAVLTLLGVSLIGGLARWAYIPAIVAVLLLIPIVATMRKLRGALELYRDDRGALGARIVSKSGREHARLDGPMRVERGLVPLGRNNDLMLCFGSRSGTFPIVIHCDSSGGPAAWRESWYRLDRSIWRRVETRHRCFKLPEVVQVLDDEGVGTWRER